MKVLPVCGILMRRNGSLVPHRDCHYKPHPNNQQLIFSFKLSPNNGAPFFSTQDSRIIQIFIILHVLRLYCVGNLVSLDKFTTFQHMSCPTCLCTDWITVNRRTDQLLEWLLLQALFHSRLTSAPILASTLYLCVIVFASSFPIYVLSPEGSPLRDSIKVLVNKMHTDPTTSSIHKVNKTVNRCVVTASPTCLLLQTLFAATLQFSICLTSPASLRPSFRPPPSYRILSANAMHSSLPHSALPLPSFFVSLTSFHPIRGKNPSPLHMHTENQQPTFHFACFDEYLL